MATAFTEQRLATMRRACETSGEARILAGRADFSAALVAGDEHVVLRVDGGALELDATAPTGQEDFTLTGAPEAWEAYFGRSGGPAHTSIFSMIIAGAVSDGVLESTLAPGGSQTKLFAHGRMLSAVLDTAVQEA
jgi:hypothetical protein